MKRFYLFFIAVFFVVTSCETNTAVSTAFAKYSHRKDVTSITIPGWLISLGARFGDLEKEERRLLDCIDKVKVLAIENESLNERINLHKEFHDNINKNNDYEELLTVNDDEQNVTIFGKMDENVIREMIVLVGGNDNAIVYLKGEIEPEMLNDVIKMSENKDLLSFDF